MCHQSKTQNSCCCKERSFNFGNRFRVIVYLIKYFSTILSYFRISFKFIMCTLQNFPFFFLQIFNLAFDSMSVYPDLTPKKCLQNQPEFLTLKVINVRNDCVQPHTSTHSKVHTHSLHTHVRANTHIHASVRRVVTRRSIRPDAAMNRVFR